MVYETRLYDVLGVAPTASPTDLRKAYRKLALIHHPDKVQGGPTAESDAKFKEIGEAYEILSDEKKRQIYDARGMDAAKGNGGPGDVDAQDIFSQFFGSGMFGNGGGRRQPSGPRRGRDMAHALKVSLEDLYKGKTSKLQVTKSVICSTCDDKGGKEGAVKQCSRCHGRGVETEIRQMGPMVQQIQHECRTCGGEGEEIDPRHKCKKCNGKKVVSERKQLEVNIDRGMKDGQKVVFQGEADQAPGIIPGDIVIVVQEKEHPRFKRRGDDLHYEAEVDLLTALAGGNIHIQHLDDRVLNVSILPGEVIRPNEIKVIEGQGMPSYRHHDPGNLFVKFSVRFPESNWTSEENIKKLEEILPAREPVPSIPKGFEEEEAVLSAIDSHHQRKMNGGEDDMDEDYEEAQQGPGVQCAQQ
ncbi:chaperone regulator [Coemansia reversa NRRL 1564]|uniref:Chaperone regulator n=1 Tax=Coemansia reversa (strain ATCC 12441 / NRRL 1564) TaxID=763665 RepID=A0A2G5BCB3_COERN|nr:chaperone regulator [Coemansia reversa NRRL 1564]|eukprot:PIA16648.1 chaperone regulator [Coemansia reversa NRRL 1564]